MADMVIYGGSFAGVSAARAAATLFPEADIILVSPEERLGSIGTVGGQNFFDIRTWPRDPRCHLYVTRGSFDLWYTFQGQGYNTDELAAFMAAALAQHKGVTVLFGHELESTFAEARDPLQLGGVVVRPVARRDGALTWAGPARRVTGRVFIDASDTDRLTRLSRFHGSVGREDWANDCHQQVATLMFQLTGIDTRALLAAPGFYLRVDEDGSQLIWGGGNFIWAQPAGEVVRRYNAMPHPFWIKPFNLAQNGAGSGTWWMNMLLREKVDGRKHLLDWCTPRWPAAAEPDTLDTDGAWIAFMAEIQSPRFLEALRSFPGFGQARLVMAGGRPAAGEVLYLRETIHLTLEPGKLEYALTAAHCTGAGTRRGEGADAALFDRRIGLLYYWIDINGYLKGEPVPPLGEMTNPVYAPYEMLLHPEVPNLLVPGYACCCDSRAWAMARVIPNLCVLGDAAGAAAALSLLAGTPPLWFRREEVRRLQQRLAADLGARLDKEA